MNRTDEELDLALEQCWDDMVSLPEATLKRLFLLESDIPHTHPLYAKTLFYIGCCYIYTGEFQQSVTQLNRALGVANEQHDLHQVRRINNSLGMAYKSLGQYGKAVGCLERAIELSHRFNFPEGELPARLNLINLYFDLQDHDSTQEQLTAILAIQNDFKNDEWNGEIALMQARIALQYFDFPSAQAQIKTALEIAERIQYNHLRINSLIIKGRLLRLKGSLDAATHLLVSVIGDPHYVLEGVAGLVAKLELAKAYLSAHEPMLANEILDQAMDRLDEENTEHGKVRLQVFELLAICAEQRHEYQLAYQHLQKASGLSDSVSNLRIRQMLAVKKQQHEQEQERTQRSITERENAALKVSQEQLKVINTVAIELASTLDMTELGGKLYQLMNRYFDAHFVSLSVNDIDNKAVVFRTIIDDGIALPLFSLPWMVQNSRTIECIEKRKARVYREAHPNIRGGDPNLVPRAQLYLPLIQEDAVIGVLSIQSEIETRFEGDDLELILSISPFISLALGNTLSHEQVNDLYDELVHEKYVLEQAQKQIHHMAHHDTLTELPNRRALEEHLTLLLVQAKLGKSPFSLVYIDLDGFKPVNDAHGHLIGDQVLQLISNRIRSVLRKTDFASRVGGDEFVVVVETGGHKHVVEALVKRLLSSIEQPLPIDSVKVHLSASIGVVDFSEQAQTLDELMHYADQAMYDVKRSGKGGIKYFGPTHNA